MQALILAGGEATRLRPLTSTIPKPVVPLGDRPFIAHVIEWLRRHGPEWRVAIERVKRFACVVQPYGRQRAF